MLAWLVGACPFSVPAGQTESAPSRAAAAVQVWVTTANREKLLSAQPEIAFVVHEPLPIHIDVDADQRYQTMVGFGAALTDASAWLIQTKLNATARAELLQELFGLSPGIGLSFTRLSIGASDFSRRHYSLDDAPAGEADPVLAHFSIDANRGDVLPVVRAALVINPRLRVMASPWSAPAWMKTSGSLISGSLREQYYEAFARYLLRYVDAYAAEGVPIFALSLQNEPAFEPSDYPGMRLDSRARARLIGEHLGPALERRKSSTLIFDWDHNWDLPSEPLGVLSDPAAARYIAAVAWHCYAGDISAQTLVHDAFPDKDTYLTECSGGDWEPVKSGGLTLLTRQLIIQASRGWARGVLLWNLALDEKSGPHSGGCGNCRGVVTIDSANGSVVRNDEYYALAHASRFVRPGAHRVGSSVAQAGIDNVAFRNVDDGSLVVVVSNSAHGARRFSVGHLGKSFRYELPAKSVATFVWNPGDGGS